MTSETIKPVGSLPRPANPATDFARIENITSDVARLEAIWRGEGEVRDEAKAAVTVPIEGGKGKRKV